MLSRFELKAHRYEVPLILAETLSFLLAAFAFLGCNTVVLGAYVASMAGLGAVALRHTTATVVQAGVFYIMVLVMALFRNLRGPVEGITNDVGWVVAWGVCGTLCAMAVAVKRLNTPPGTVKGTLSY